MNNILKPFVVWKPLNKYLANREDPDEMPHGAVFRQGIHVLLRYM